MPNPSEDSQRSTHWDVLDEPSNASTNSIRTADKVLASESSSVTGLRATTLAIGLLLFAAAIALPLFRQTGSRSWQTIWAEDGTIYFQQAHQHGGLAVLLRSYKGYEQLPPRLLAVFSALVPLRQLPVYLAISSTFVAALLALFLYHYSDGWITSRLVRLALASMLVLMPVLGPEDTANITNTIWIFAAVAPWALISLQDRRRDIVIRCVVVFLAATATSVSLLFIPLALGYALIRKSRAIWVVAAVFAGGLVIQVWVIFSSHYRGPALGHPPISVLVQATAMRVFAMFLVGNRGEENPFSRGEKGLLILIAVICFVMLVALFPGAGRRSQVMGVVLIAYAVVTFAGVAWYRHAAGIGIFASPSRYSVIPLMMLGSAVAVLVAPADRSRDRTTARLGRPIFAGYVLVLILSGFFISNTRSTAPTWSTSLSYTYQADCQGARSTKLVEVPTEKFSYFGVQFFPVTLPCHDLAP
jgi:hypothetical protein